MKTQQPVLRNGRNVWDPVNMPASEFEARAGRIREEMRKSGLDVLLLYGRAFDEYADPCYVSNFLIRLARGILAVVPAQGSPAVFFEGASRGLPSLQAFTAVKELKAAGNIPKEVAAYLREKGLVPSRVGLGRLAELMPQVEFRALKEAFSECTLVDASRLVPELRMRKSEREADQLRRSGRVLRRAFRAVGAMRFPELTEAAVDAAVRKEARLEGAGDFRMLVARPGGSFRPTEERPIDAGSTVIVHAALELERYWAEAARTFVAGEGVLSEVPAGKRAFFARAVDAVRPGRDVAEVRREVLEAVRRWGAEPLTEYPLGNGVGLSPEEAPWLEEGAEGRLEEGMSLALRLGARDPAQGTVLWGGTLLVAKDGAELITE
ncbi:MAG: aminopeptidase P family protein [Deltaproteobacteria bacterium]|nr:aminopeptidase P family protein [Deltaproteobacteria bacterium]